VQRLQAPQAAPAPPGGCRAVHRVRHVVGFGPGTWSGSDRCCWLGS
jgi:hypothetical protein